MDTDMTQEEFSELMKELLRLGIPVDLAELEQGTRAAKAILSRILASKGLETLGKQPQTVTDFIGRSLVNDVMPKNKATDHMLNIGFWGLLDE